MMKWQNYFGLKLLQSSDKILLFFNWEVEVLCIYDINSVSMQNMYSNEEKNDRNLRKPYLKKIRYRKTSFIKKKHGVKYPLDLF